SGPCLPRGRTARGFAVGGEGSPRDMRSGEGRRRVAVWSVRWLALAPLWLALADSRARPELIAAAAAALIGAASASPTPRPGRPRTLDTTARLSTIGPRRLGRPPVRLVLDNGPLAEAL